MHQRRTLERLPRPLAGEVSRGEPPQLIIDERQELFSCRSIA
jgi:hypothetical protein